MKSYYRIIMILWIFLSWGLIVVSRFSDTLNQVILKIVIPSIFLILLFIEKGKIKLSIPILMYTVFVFWGFYSITYTVNFEMTLNYIQILVGNILLWYITLTLIENFKNKNIFLLLLGLTFLFHGILGWIIPPENEAIERMYGIYTNPNALGFAMWYGIIIFLYFYLISNNFITRKKYLVIILFMLWILIYTASRKSFLAVIVSFAIVIFYTKLKSFKKLFFFVPLVIIVYMFMSDFILNGTPLGERLNPGYVERSTNIRTQLVSEGLTFFVEHPFKGIGLGSFTSYSSSGMMSHNDYIEILSSMGVIGFILYMLIFWYYYKEISTLLKFKETFNFGVISLSFLVGYLVLGMGRPAFLDPIAIIIFATFQGIGAIKIRELKKVLIENERLKNENNSKLITK